MGQWKITAVHTQAAEKIYIRGEKRMGKEKITDQAMYDFYGKMPLKRAIPLGLQHVLAMFVGNLTPLLIITGVCGIESGSALEARSSPIFRSVFYRTRCL